MSLLNGNALVTGAGECTEMPCSWCPAFILVAGSGIGRQLSLAYVRAGIQGITLVDMNKDAIAETAKLIKAEFPHAKTLEVAINVTDEQAVNSMVDQAVQTFGSLDCGKILPSTTRPSVAVA